MQAINKRRLTAGVAALGAALVALVLLFPVSCSTYDAPPGSEPSEPECPAAATIAGIEWPNMYAGFVIAPLVAAGAGAGAAYAAIRRGPSYRDPNVKTG